MSVPLPDSSVELLTFPELLCNPSVKTDSLQMFGLGFGADASRIDTRFIRDAHIHYRYYPHPSELWPDEYRASPISFSGPWQIHNQQGYFYGEGYEWLLEDRIPRAIKHGGSLVTEDGHYYIIENQQIDGFNLNAQAIPSFSQLTKRDIVTRFGMPDFFAEVWNEDPGLFSTSLYYQQGIMLYYSDIDNMFQSIYVRRDIRELIYDDTEKPYSFIQPYVNQLTYLFN